MNTTSCRPDAPRSRARCRYWPGKFWWTNRILMRSVIYPMPGRMQPGENRHRLFGQSNCLPASDEATARMSLGDLSVSHRDGLWFYSWASSTRRKFLSELRYSLPLSTGRPVGRWDETLKRSVRMRRGCDCRSPNVCGRVARLLSFTFLNRSTTESALARIL